MESFGKGGARSEDEDECEDAGCAHRVSLLGIEDVAKKCQPALLSIGRFRPPP
jgi:hypothetical protein